MIQVREYLDANDRSPFGRWFNGLDVQAALKVTTALTRFENGNTSQLKGVGGGAFEARVQSGPGYRIYMGKDGDRLIILLGGGTKRRQCKAITNAKAAWQDYKGRKKGGLR